VKRSVTVPLPEHEAAQLIELAERERRGARDQAAVLLIDAIKRAVRLAERNAENR
jgi:hypothetical protein